MQLTGVQCFDEDGDVATVTGVMIDTQERRDLEDEAIGNEERFQRLTKRGGAGYFDLDLDTETAWFSPTFRRALGRREDELNNTVDAFLGLLPPEDAEVGVDAFLLSLANHPRSGVSRYRLLHGDGRTLQAEAILAFERDRHGRIARVSGLQLIGAGAEEAATSAAGSTPSPASTSESSSLLAALDAVAEAVVLVDTGGRIIHANSRTAQMAGVPVDDLQFEPVAERLPLVERATGAPAGRVVAVALAEGRSIDLDHSYAIETESGRAEIVLTCRPLLDARGHPSGAIMVLRKPSEIPLSPAELIASNRMEALGRLACGIAHDFANLLTTVIGGISLAVEKHDWAPLGVAQKACNNAKNLARQLLTFARGDTSGKKVARINDTIRETARMTGAGASVTIELELDEDVHPVAIDAAQFVQVFTNLILNAIQVMDAGGRIWIRTINMPLGQVNSVGLAEGDYVRIDVQDNGPGIPPENLEHVFEPFFTTRAEGTGLGLPMVRSIISQHDGAIEISSTVGSGTTFTIYLPRAENPVVNEEAPRPIAISYGTGRILLMDDDPDLCMIAKGMLEMLGYEAESASSAADAITMFRKNREIGKGFAAVILDLTMAGGPGGEEVLARLKEIDPAVTAVVSSGYASDENAPKYLNLGFAGVLSKPYRSSDLGRVLKQVLQPAG
jgi:signal transduction histidine kinase/CheY-like chemotaxis protein